MTLTIPVPHTWRYSTQRRRKFESASGAGALAWFRLLAPHCGGHSAWRCRRIWQPRSFLFLSPCIGRPCQTYPWNKGIFNISQAQQGQTRRRDYFFIFKKWKGISLEPWASFTKVFFFSILPSLTLKRKLRIF